MFVQSRKISPWKTSDYVRTIFLFVLHTIIIAGIYIATIYLNDPSQAAFVEYFKNTSTRKDFLYLVVETTILVGIMYLYFIFENRNAIKIASNVNLIFVIVEISLLMSYIVGKYVGIYARPFALCAILTLMLVDRTSAITVNTVLCIMVFIMDTFTNINFVGTSDKAIFSSLILGFTCGVLGIYLVNQVLERAKLFLLGSCISIPAFICVLILEVIPHSANSIWLIALSIFSGILSIVFVMIFLPLLEYIFNVDTDFRLAELTDSNAKLIKRLRLQAPGTYQHCIVVSTLAQACAIAIGEKAIMARAAAYYHDMGKLKNPEFFAENQMGENPHAGLTPELSVDIIRSHTTDGYDLIQTNNLPQFLADVALQHHGTLPIRYFYAKALKFTDNEVDIRNYSYQGPKPQTKIAAIIMICDASEAKIRSMNDRSGEKVDRAVREIIEERMELDQFSECDITLREIEIIRNAIVENIAGIYHDRVKYPKIKIRKTDIEGKE